MGIITWLIIGALAGWIASLIMGREEGLLANIIVGIIGALIGGYLSTFVGGIGVTGLNFTSVVIAVLGAIILLAIVRAFSGSSSKQI